MFPPTENAPVAPQARVSESNVSHPRGIRTRVSLELPAHSSNLVCQARALHRQGNEWLDKGGLSQAAESYEQAVELAPESAEVHMSLGYALLQLGRFGEREEDL